MRFILFFLTWFASLVSLAQKTYRFEDLSINEGLSQSGVTCLVQDEIGYLWVGTQDGLNRYDGQTFKIYRNRQSDSLSIVKNLITHLFVDVEKNLWVATLGYLSKYNPSTDTFSNYKLAIDGVAMNPEVYIWSVAEYSPGVIALSTNEGFFHFDIRRKQFFLQDEFKQIVGKPVVAFFKTKAKGNFVIGNTFTLQKLPGVKDWMYSPAEILGAFYLPAQDQVYTFFKSLLLKYVSPGKWEVDYRFKYWASYVQMHNMTNGDMWLAWDDHILIYDKQGNLNDKISSFEIVGSASNPIRALYQTRDGVIWIGTLGYGLKKYNPRANQFGYLGTSSNSTLRLRQNYVDAIYTNNDTIIYVSTPDGIDVVDLSAKKSIPLSAPGRIRHIMTDEAGELWLLNEDEAWLLKGDKFISAGLSQHRDIKLYPKIKRAIIAGARIKLLNYGKWEFLFDEISSYDVQELQVYGDTVWVGFGATAPNPLNLYQFSTRKRIKQFYNHPNDDSFIQAAGGIKCVFRDSKKRMWIGTGGNGLCLYHPEQDKFTHYRVEDGLPNNVVYGILEDNDGNLWLSTNKGLCKFNPETRQMQNFDVFDGLQSNEFNTGAFFKSKSGRMYFGGINGVTYFDPQKINTGNPVSKATITGYYVNGKQITNYEDFLKKTDTTSYFTLKYSERDFGFDFITIGFSLPARARYRYMLENYDNQWHDIGSLQHINFTNIQPGSYTFKVKASDSYGNWQEEATLLPIVIDAPLWRKPWLWILISLAALMVLPGFYYVHIHSLKNRAIQLEKIVADRTIEIQQQNKEIAFQNATLLEQAAMLKEKNLELEQTKDLLELEVKFFHQQKLLKTSIETLDEERKRISQDLHDELGAVLSIARMHIVRVRDLYAKGMGNLEPNLLEVFKLTEAALATMRRISHELMPPTLNEFGLIKTIESTMQQINEAQKLKVMFETPDVSMRWPMTVELNLYRIFMELVNNTLKHSQAKQIEMVLRQDADTLLFTYQDDGSGIRNQKTDGRGLSNIEMRVTTMGGTFRIDKNRSNGFYSIIHIPVNLFLQVH